MNPLEVSKAIEKRIRRQIRKSLPVERSVPELGPIIDRFFDQEYPLSKDPYLEAVTAYQPAESLNDLAIAGVIHPETAKIFACYFSGEDGADPALIRLHAHQAAAVREVCANQKNLVVCSGTGSGKTESFLIPLIDALVREHSQDQLTPGVRAMILYPRNALVNDQIRRLRNILRWAPQIRFGKYTGETEQDDLLKGDRLEEVESALDELTTKTHPGYANLGFDDEGALPNEVATRRSWRESPAHILVTNYSMLERLLLQPNTNILFGEHWKFIVLDEAHCYSGALGTEIAWLVRRVKRRVEAKGAPPGQLRFLATSATLISDPKLTNEQKAERIRERFASRLFPAPPDSFAVQFGEPAKHPILDCEPESLPAARRYIELLDARFNPDERMSLIEASQQYLGRKSWQKRMMQGLEVVRRSSPQVAVGDLLVVVSEVQAAAEVVAADENSAFDPQLPADAKLLDSASQASIMLMLEVLVKAVGRLTDHRAWRSWLHDPSDPSPSSLEKDTYDSKGKSRKQPLGNRLHLLQEWSRPVEQWSQDALEWLLKISSRLAASTETGFEPNSLQVTMSTSCREALNQAGEQLKKESQNNQNLATALDIAWSHALSCDPTGDFQETLARFLANDLNLALLRDQLASVTTVDQAEHATSGALASAIFEQDPDREQGLDALISLGTLAKELGKRTPLLDVRYHQMVRGVEAPGLRLEADPNGGVRVQLLPALEDDGLSFGLCRECGQPYALGYAETPALVGLGPFRLSPTIGLGRNCLHAFAWRRGELLEDQEEPKQQDLADLWLNTRSGEVQRNQPEPANPNWVPVIAHASPNDTYKEFIKSCPTCDEEHKVRPDARYGIITPYDASGDSVRMAAMEELARRAGASTDPEARRLPGKGRKVLVFSDSRSGSAGMALGFQEYFAETSVGQLVEKACVLAGQAVEPTNEEVLAANHIPNNQWPLYMSNPAFMQMQRDQWAINHPQEPTFARVSEHLEKLIRQNNLDGLLSVAEVDDDGKVVGELEPVQASQWRLLNAILRKGRHAMRTRQLVRLSARCLQRTSDQYLLDLKLSTDDSGRQILSGVLERILSWLADRVEVSLLDGFPTDQIQRHKKTISFDGVDQTIRWHSDDAKSNLNRYLRCVIAEETSFWLDDLRVAVVEVKGSPALNVARRFAGLDDVALKELASKICQQRKVNGPPLLPAEVADNASPTAQNEVLKKVKSFFVNRAAQWLKDLWPLFTKAADGGDNKPLLVDSGGGQYRLNPEALLIFPGEQKTTATDRTVPLWAEEDADLASRQIIPLRIEEHTAQLAKERGSTYQRAFANGHINILSCSTTFEMGVDLGDLSSVFLNGMPPAVANYRQRAGRAGRRPGSPSYVLTFLGRRDHDRYFWECPGELLFAEMEEPKIYLDNPIYRARHFRAEAFHNFLAWLEQGDRRQDQTATRFTEENVQILVQPGTKTRKWNNVGDLFAGKTVANKRRQDDKKYPVTWCFRPLVDELPKWLQDSITNLQAYLEAMDDVGTGTIPYDVAADLVWQMKEQEIGNAQFQPYDLGHPEHEWEYRLLGGPNWPRAGGPGLENALLDDKDKRPDVRRLSVQAQVRHFLPDKDTALLPFQKHLLQEQTITWLSRCRVLPKYGFPVDVINLLPHVEDPFGTNVKLERDLKDGLFEYAPGQVVVADKRRYTSASAVVWSNGSFSDVQGGNLIERWICSTCNEPDWSADPDNAPAQCRYCGPEGTLRRVSLCFPDAFQAEKSTPSFKHKGDRGSAIHVHTRAFRFQGVRLENSGLVTKESESGSVTYINQGPGNRGFRDKNGQNFSLCHEVRTDVAGWMLAPSLFQQGRLLAIWANESCEGRKRLESAMRSAMFAILRAISRVKGIEEREVQGILQPGSGKQGELGIVLFDDSSGGGGAVLDLVLSGCQKDDEKRAPQILRILEEAVALCEHCQCGAVQPEQVPMMPVTKDELRGQPDYRLSSSCYRCLRSHRNQRDHSLLDRFDAAALIREILHGGPEVQPGIFTRQQLNELAEPLLDTFTFEDDSGERMALRLSAEPLTSNTWALVRLPDGFAYGKWMVMDRTKDAFSLKRLRLSDGIGLPEPVQMTSAQFQQLPTWTQVT